MSEFADVPVPSGWVLNEYHERLSQMTTANVRLTVMVRSAIEQRNNALRRIVDLEEELRGRSNETSTLRASSNAGI